MSDVGVFHSAWNKHRLAVLPKANTLSDKPSLYRPLCMIDTVGKMFQRIICNGLGIICNGLDEVAEQKGWFFEHS